MNVEKARYELNTIKQNLKMLDKQLSVIQKIVYNLEEAIFDYEELALEKIGENYYVR